MCSVMMAKLEWKEDRARCRSGGCLNATNLRGAGHQQGVPRLVWMPEWGARGTPHYHSDPAVCRGWDLLRVVVFLQWRGAGGCPTGQLLSRYLLSS